MTEAPNLRARLLLMLTAIGVTGATATRSMLFTKSSTPLPTVPPTRPMRTPPDRTSCDSLPSSGASFVARADINALLRGPRSEHSLQCFKRCTILYTLRLLETRPRGLVEVHAV